MECDGGDIQITVDSDESEKDKPAAVQVPLLLDRITTLEKLVTQLEIVNKLQTEKIATHEKTVHVSSSSMPSVSYSQVLQSS